MSRRDLPISVAAKTLEKAVRLIKLEAEAATLEALSAKEGLQVLRPIPRSELEFDWWPCGLNVWRTSKPFNKVMWLAIYHTPSNEDRRFQGIYWLAEVSMIDQRGKMWTQSFGRMIVDDFGTLVPLGGGES